MLTSPRGRDRQDQVSGLALHRPYLNNPQYDDRLSGYVWRSCWDPCPNCKELIRIWGRDDSDKDAAENCLKRFKPSRNGTVRMGHRHKLTFFFFLFSFFFFSLFCLSFPFCFSLLTAVWLSGICKYSTKIIALIELFRVSEFPRERAT